MTRHPSRKRTVSCLALLLGTSYLLSLPTLASTQKLPEPAYGRPVPPAPLESTTNGWVTILSEDFEGVFPSGKWTVRGDPTWDDDDFKPHWGSWSAWCANGGAHSLDPASSEYPNYTSAGMKYGPFDLSDAFAAELSFYAWYETEPNRDPWVVWASPDDLRWDGWETNGSSNGQWEYYQFDLTDFPIWGDLTGDASVWIEFAFGSDGSVTDQGVFIDDITLRKRVSAASDTEPPAIHRVRASHNPLNEEACGDPRQTIISADVQDSASGIDWVRLYHRPPGGTWTHSTMSLGSAHTYGATIGPFAQTGTVQYYVKARDDAGNEAQSDQFALAVAECGWVPLYFDDFGDPNSGWGDWDDEDLSWGYLDGEYRIVLKRSHFILVTGGKWDQQCEYPSVAVEARLGSPNEGAYGVVMGGEWSDAYGQDSYSVLIRPSGHYRVAKTLVDQPDETYVLVDWTSFPHIYGGQSTNLVRLTYEGAQLSLYINGHRATTIPDSSATGLLRAHVVVFADETPNVDVRFDNFGVSCFSRPTAMPTSTPTPTATRTPTPTPTATRPATQTAVYLPLLMKVLTTCPSGDVFYDGFDIATLDPAWSWVNEDPTHWSLSARPGFLRIVSSSGAIWEENLLLQDAPSGDFTVTTRMLFQPTANYQLAGIVLYEDAENHLVLGRAFCDASPPNCVGNGIYFDNDEGGQDVGSNYASSTTSLGEAYLRVVRVGTTYYGYYSEDGENWSLVGSHIRATADLSKVALGVGQDQSGARIPADFDFFELRWG